MAKLDERKRKRIIAEYIDGNGATTQSQLAQKYGVSRQAISLILKDKKTCQNLRNKKKELDKEITEDFETHIRKKGKELNEIANLTFSLVKEKLEAKELSPREAVGALKILAELTLATPKPIAEGEELTGIKVEFEDASGGGNGTDDKNSETV